MIPNPIIKVLSMLSCHEVRHLLMGGQACVFYGAAEFSRDCDIVVVADNENLMRLNSALAELQAECIAVPPYETQYLERGHAVHFRCQHADAMGIRLDVMTRMAVVIARADRRNAPLVVSRDGEVVEVNPHELEWPSTTYEPSELPSGLSSKNN